MSEMVTKPAKKLAKAAKAATQKPVDCMGFKFTVGEDDLISLTLFNYESQPAAVIKMDVDFMTALKAHLEGARDVALGIIPNNTLH